MQLNLHCIHVWLYCHNIIVVSAVLIGRIIHIETVNCSSWLSDNMKGH